MFRSQQVRPHGRSARIPCARAIPIALAGLALVGLAPRRAAAQALGGKVSIEALTGAYFPDDVAFETGETGLALEDHRIMYGGRLGFAFSRHLFIEGSVAYSPLRFSFAGTQANLNTLMYDAVLGLNFPLMGRLEGVLLGGGGMTRWTLDGGGSLESANAVVGGGFRLHLSPWLAFRAEARDHIIFDSYTELREQLNPGLDLSEQTTHSVEVTAGFALSFPLIGGGGGGYDPDNWVRAGQPGGNRARPDPEPQPEPEPQPADDAARPDDGATANAVQPQIEIVPTPRPESRLGHNGEPAPAAPMGPRVESASPAVSEASGTLVLAPIRFDTERAVLGAASVRALDEVGRALLARPGVRVEVQGHSDSTGDPGYNLRLSWARAQAVQQELLVRFPSLDPRRVVVRGYGDTRPVASNDTGEGRALNRRVELVVIEQ